MKILNLTQHPATPEQKAAGVIDLRGVEKEMLTKWLTFETIPNLSEIQSRAKTIADMAVIVQAWEPVTDAGYLPSRAAMIGGAPYLMGPLEQALLAVRIEALYAFSQRVSVETANGDGTVNKSTVFRHGGFISVGSRARIKARKDALAAYTAFWAQKTPNETVGNYHQVRQAFMAISEDE